ncbi:MAG TPA: hypothetical protein DCZ75_09265 [Geobacter sp.]|nr:hypothetical protein [Geobacter sp.]
MVTKPADLQRIKGVGRVLGKRLYETGLDSFEKIAQTGEEELSKVRGITHRNVKSILDQARELTEAEPTAREERVKALKQLRSEVSEKVQTLAEGTRARFQEEVAGKSGKKLSADLNKVLNVLEKIGESGKSGKRCSKRAAKALGKAEKRIAGLEEASLKKVRKGLKKARKAVLKVL